MAGDSNTYKITLRVTDDGSVKTFGSIATESKALQKQLAADSDKNSSSLGKVRLGTDALDESFKNASSSAAALGRHALSTAGTLTKLTAISTGVMGLGGLALGLGGVAGAGAGAAGLVGGIYEAVKFAAKHGDQQAKAGMKSINGLEMQGKRLLVTVGQAFAPIAGKFARTLETAIMPIAKLIGPLAKSLGGPLNGLSHALAAYLPKFVSLIASVAPAMVRTLTAFMPVLMSVSQMLTGVFANTLQKLVPTVDKFMTTLAPALGSILNTAIPVMSSLLSSLMPVLKPLGTAFSYMIKEIGPVLNVFARALVSIMPALTQSLKNIMPPLTAAMKVLLPFVASAITKWLPPLTHWIGQALPPLTKEIKEKGPGFINAITKMINKLGPSFDKFVTTAAPKLANALMKLATWLSQHTNLLMDLAKAWLVNKATGGLASKAASAGGGGILGWGLKKIGGFIKGRIKDFRSPTSLDALGGDALDAGELAGAAAAGEHNGGLIRRFARGGFVPGTGVGDRVPAMLEPGEYVIPRKVVQQAGANISPMLANARQVASAPGGAGNIPVQIPISVQMGNKVVAQQVYNVQLKYNTLRGAWGT